MTKCATFMLLLFIANTAGAQNPAGAKELFGGGVNRKVVGSPQRGSTSAATYTPASKPVTPPFGLSCWIELVESAGRQGSQVVHTRMFKSGERIRLHFTGNANGYISLVQLGASGTASVLFPDTARGLVDNAIRAGADEIIPSEKHWFKFDNTPGTEHLLVLFAKTREELDRFVNEQAMDLDATAAMLQFADRVTGGKDLITEIVEDEATYTVNKMGNLIVMRLALVHQ